MALLFPKACSEARVLGGNVTVVCPQFSFRQILTINETEMKQNYNRKLFCYLNHVIIFSVLAIQEFLKVVIHGILCLI